MRRVEFESALSILEEFNRSDLTVTLAGNERQVELLEEEHREACLRFHRKLNRLRQSAAGLSAERDAILGTDIPYARQEFLLLGSASPAAKVIVSSKLRGLRDKVEVIDSRLEAKVRQLRLNARALSYFQQSTRSVGSGYELIFTALMVLDHMEALGIDPKEVGLDDRRRLETYFEVTD